MRFPLLRRRPYASAMSGATQPRPEAAPAPTIGGRDRMAGLAGPDALSRRRWPRWKARAAAIREERRRRADLAARAPAFVHRRHQRRSGRTVQSRRAFRSSPPAAAAATPITAPGQRVVYAMLDLDRRGRDLRRYVHALEGWAIAALAELGVAAWRAEGRIGIWTDSPQGRGEDRRDRRAGAPLGDDARLRDQCGAGTFPLFRHRSMRYPGVSGDQPRRAGRRRKSRPPRSGAPARAWRDFSPRSGSVAGRLEAGCHCV